MPAFDEMLELEDRAQRLELDISKTKEFIRYCSRRILEIKNTLPGLDASIAELEASLKYMKGSDARIVLLSEYESQTNLLSQHLEIRAARRQELKRLEKEGRGAEAALPGLETQLRQAEKKLSTYGRVIPFRTPR